MPGNKHLHGVSAKEQREYEHIKESAQRSGRYGDRAKEVAARTVLKKHKAQGHSKGIECGALRGCRGAWRRSAGYVVSCQSGGDWSERKEGPAWFEFLW